MLRMRNAANGAPEATPGSGPFKRLLSKHRLFACIFLLLVIIRIPLLSHIPEYVLLDQDYNPTHFGMLFSGESWPKLDDSDVGENSRTLAWSTVYYLVPALFYNLGVPFDFFYGLHLLLGLPVLLLLIYAISFTLFRNPVIASFSALNFHVARWIFSLNVGYPLSFDLMCYQGDINHIPAAAFVLFLLLQWPMWAGLASMVLSLFNPTYGVNAVILFGAFLFWKICRREVSKPLVAGFIIAAAGVAASLVLVHLATPIKAPIPEIIRNFCIRTFAHTAPHDLTLKYLQAMLGLLVLFGGASALEKYWRPRLNGGDEKHFYDILKLFFVLFVIYSIGVYFALYLWSPELFLMLSPSKSLQFYVLLFSAYIGMALYSLFCSWPPLSLILILPYAYWSMRQGAYFSWTWDQYSWHFPLFLAILWLLGLVILMRRRTDTPSRAPARWGQGLLLVVLFLGSAAMTWSLWLRSPAVTYAAAFYDMQKQVKKTLPKDTILIPYSMSSHNPFGLFKGFPMRTYSRRGALILENLGRNCYFNSQERLKMEELVFNTAGIDVWKEILTAAKRAETEDWSLYYFGIRSKPSFGIERKTLGYAILEQERQKLYNHLSAMNLSEFMDYGRRLGATHIVVCKDPNQHLNWHPVIIDNGFFAVVEIPYRK